MRRVSESTCDTLAEIHKLDWRAVGLGELGKPEGTSSGRCGAGPSGTARRGPTTSHTSSASARGSRRTGPPRAGRRSSTTTSSTTTSSSRPTSRGVIAVLDWEMATIGDPLMDLGTALGYWVEADDPPVFQVTVFGPTNRPGNLTRVQFVERWSRATGRDASNVLFYYAFALFKLAVVAQQLYKRYVDGLTKEERYVAHARGRAGGHGSALVAIDKGRIDRLAE